MRNIYSHNIDIKILKKSIFVFYAEDWAPHMIREWKLNLFHYHNKQLKFNKQISDNNKWMEKNIQFSKKQTNE